MKVQHEFKIKSYILNIVVKGTKYDASAFYNSAFYYSRKAEIFPN